MLGKTLYRRLLSALLAILGAALIFLAPETWAGVLLLALGVFIELASIAIKRIGSR